MVAREQDFPGADRSCNGDCTGKISGLPGIGRSESIAPDSTNTRLTNPAPESPLDAAQPLWGGGSSGSPHRAQYRLAGEFSSWQFQQWGSGGLSKGLSQYPDRPADA